MNSILKRTLAIVPVAALVFYGGQVLAQNGKYVLKGNIASTKGKIYLGHEVEGKPVIIDSTSVVNGTFTFKGSIKQTDFYNLSNKNLKYPIQFILENSAITITQSADSLSRPEIKGSAAQDVYMGFYEGPWKVITAKAGDIYGRLDNAGKSGKIDSITRAGFDREFRSLDTLNIAAVKAYVIQHPSSAGSAAIIYERFIGYPNFPVATELFALLDKGTQQSAIGSQITTALQTDAKTAKGKIAPAISMADKDGNIVKLSHFKGKYVLIDFWASWCVPCRAENPNVVKAYEQFKDKNFDVLGISIDTSKPSWVKALKEDHLIWKNVLDNGTVAKQYNVHSVPSNFLLDPNGKIIARNLRGDQIIEELQKIQSLNQ